MCKTRFLDIDILGPTLVSYRGNRHRPPARHRQDRLQYTAPHLASAQCNYKEKHKILARVVRWRTRHSSPLLFPTICTPRLFLFLTHISVRY